MAKRAWGAGERAQDRSNAGQTFLPLQTRVSKSQSFTGLSGAAVRMLCGVLGSQFNGRNNGDLEATYQRCAAHGIASRDSIRKALRELLDARLIVQSRQGDRRRASLYAFTWLRINECDGKLDIKSTATAPRVHWPMDPRIAELEKKRREIRDIRLGL